MSKEALRLCLRSLVEERMQKEAKGGARKFIGKAVGAGKSLLGKAVSGGKAGLGYAGKNKVPLTTGAGVGAAGALGAGWLFGGKDSALGGPLGRIPTDVYAGAGGAALGYLVARLAGLRGGGQAAAATIGAGLGVGGMEASRLPAVKKLLAAQRHNQLVGLVHELRKEAGLKDLTKSGLGAVKKHGGTLLKKTLGGLKAAPGAVKRNWKPLVGGTAAGAGGTWGIGKLFGGGKGATWEDLVQSPGFQYSAGGAGGAALGYLVARMAGLRGAGQAAGAAVGAGLGAGGVAAYRNIG